MEKFNEADINTIYSDADDFQEHEAETLFREDDALDMQIEITTNFELKQF